MTACGDVSASDESRFSESLDVSTSNMCIEVVIEGNGGPKPARSAMAPSTTTTTGSGSEEVISSTKAIVAQYQQALRKKQQQRQVVQFRRLPSVIDRDEANCDE